MINITSFCVHRSFEGHQDIGPHSNQNPEDKPHPSYMKGQRCVNHECLKVVKAEKLRLVRALENSLGVIALHDGVVATTCAEIKQYLKGFETKSDKLYQVPMQRSPFDKIVAELKMRFDTAVKFSQQCF